MLTSLAELYPAAAASDTLLQVLGTVGLGIYGYAKLWAEPRRAQANGKAASAAAAAVPGLAEACQKHLLEMATIRYSLQDISARQGELKGAIEQLAHTVVDDRHRLANDVNNLKLHLVADGLLRPEVATTSAEKAP